MEHGSDAHAALHMKKGQPLQTPLSIARVMLCGLEVLAERICHPYLFICLSIYLFIYFSGFADRRLFTIKPT